MNRFAITDQVGTVLCGPDGRELRFGGENGWGRALEASRHRYSKGKLIAGPTTDGNQELYRGRLFLVADEPLQPSGVQRWEIQSDGGVTEI